MASQLIKNSGVMHNHWMTDGVLELACFAFWLNKIRGHADTPRKFSGLYA
jgi:hypothetical protein